MKQYKVTGMSCAACSSRVEKAVSKVSGVESCSVSLLTNSMGVEGTASSAEIIAAVEAAGYGASERGSSDNASGENGGGNAGFKKETHSIRSSAYSFDVFFHGTYDVGMASSGIF